MFHKVVSKGIFDAMHKKAAEGLFTAFMLWYISKKPTYGYEIIRTLRDEHQSVRIGPAHIYPVLAALSKRGLIKAKSVAKGKRIKKLYAITPDGKKRLKEIHDAVVRDNLRTRFLREMLT
jgi:DNA-binding PadR family transcriptional regulator